MLGLAMGAPAPRVETVAINAAHFGVADNDGDAPSGGEAFADGPAARRATWDGPAVVAAIEAEGIPARLSFHAGTHLCNASLFTCLGLLERRAPAVPCGFLHLPLLPEQVLWMKRNPSATSMPWDQPSMSLDQQVKAATGALSLLAAQSADARSGRADR
jgi:pyroglutamyl-peptidase